MRSKMTVTIIILAALACASPSMGTELPTGSLLVSISLSPDKILVGLPVAIRIDVLNPTPKPLEMPNYFAMSGRYTSTGDRFIVRRLGDGETLQDTLPADYENSRVIGAGKHQIFQIPVDESVVDPPFFSQPEFFRPGRYQVQLAFSTGFGQELDRRIDFSGLQSERPGVLLSNVVDLAVLNPTGEDAVVWQLILQRSEGRGRGGVAMSTLADDLWDNHPKSTYSMYYGAIVRHNASDERVAAIIARLSESGKPRSPMLDWQLLDSASRHVGKSYRAVSVKPRNVPLAIKEAETARSIYKDVAKSTDSELVRLRSDANAAFIMNADGYKETARRLDALDNPPPDQKVIPLPPCVRKEKDGSLSAQFGYDNPNAWSKTGWPPGSPDNRFDPEPADRGQPEVFTPGKSANAFKVALPPGVTLTWTLNGLKVTVSAGQDKEKGKDKTPQCSGDDEGDG
jgi:hypothetical protein